ncbi:MAG: glycosyltransferase [Acidimicrobiales bacterium]
MTLDHEFAGMSITHVHQILPSLHVADASGSHTLHARDALRKAGYTSELFVDLVDAPLSSEVHPFDEIDGFVVPGKTALLYQLAVGSRLVDLIMLRNEPLLINYHNLTPASFYWKWAPDWLEAVAAGRGDLYRLAGRTSHAIAVSKFNEIDLSGAGYRSTSVVSPFVTATRSDPVKRKSQPTSILFVGKMLPHKAAHHLVRALAAYKEAFDPEANLVIIGGHPIASFADAVRDYADALGIGDSVELTGSASDERVADAYRSADVFLCLSDHEGFCFPLVEAMGRGVPIVAFAAGAVPDTLGDAGILLHDKSGPVVASAIHRVVVDQTLRARLVRNGFERLELFDLDRTKEHFVDEVRLALKRIEREREEVSRDVRLRDPGGDASRGSEAVHRSDRGRDSAVAYGGATGDAEVRGAGERWFEAPASVSEVGRLANKVAGKPEHVRAIHQLVPMLVPGDATSEHAIELRRLLHDMGLESEIFATAIDDSLHSEAILMHELPDRRLPGTLLIYQMSSGSPLAELARDRKEPLAVNYHNLTPAWAYEHWDPATAADQRWARRQVAELAARASIGLCPSDYNAAELSACGFAETAVCPVLVDMNRLAGSDQRGSDQPASDKSASDKRSSSVEEELAARSDFAGGTWLFVGRIVPHKGAHRLVQALAAYNKLFGVIPHLDLIGSPGPIRYVEAVQRLSEELGVASHIRLWSGVDDAGLGSFYRHADVFVSASMHEGFCVPIVEAMYNKVPVVALAAAAVPETVASAALLVEPAGTDAATAAFIASGVYRVSSDADLRSLLVAGGTVRAEQLGLERSRHTMRRILEGWIDRFGSLDETEGAA